MESEYPPSLRAAAEVPQLATLYQHLSQIEAAATTTSPSDELDEGTVTEPFSFYQRSLQLAHSRMQYELEAMSNDSYVDLSSYPMIDSAVGSFDNLLGSTDLATAAGPHSDETRYDQLRLEVI